MNFISLEEFLTLNHSPTTYSFGGKEWLMRYKLAKESFEKGLPAINSIVKILVNGYDTGLSSIKEKEELKWFPTGKVIKIEDNYITIERNGHKFLTDRKTWWFSLYH